MFYLFFNSSVSKALVPGGDHFLLQNVVLIEEHQYLWQVGDMERVGVVLTVLL